MLTQSRRKIVGRALRLLREFQIGHTRTKPRLHLNFGASLEFIRIALDYGFDEVSSGLPIGVAGWRLSQFRHVSLLPRNVDRWRA